MSPLAAELDKLTEAGLRTPPLLRSHRARMERGCSDSHASRTELWRSASPIRICTIMQAGSRYDTRVIGSGSDASNYSSAGKRS